MMDTLGPHVSAALFRDRAKAEEAWGILAEAGIGSTIITDPGLLGKYGLSLMVEREDLERAQEALAKGSRES